MSLVGAFWRSSVDAASADAAFAEGDFSRSTAMSHRCWEQHQGEGENLEREQKSRTASSDWKCYIIGALNGTHRVWGAVGATGTALRCNRERQRSQGYALVKLGLVEMFITPYGVKDC